MRSEFSKATKKAALLRAGGVCQAEGYPYAPTPEPRCTTILTPGKVDFDHWPLPAHAENSDGLENCMAVCKAHHSYKTRTFDIPAEAKIKRRAAKFTGIVTRVKKPIARPRNFKWPSRPFN